MKYFMTTLILLVLSFPVFGQQAVNVRLGYGLAKIEGYPIMPGQPRGSTRLGGSIDIPVRERSGLQIGGDYVRKGAKGHEYEDSEIRIDYIEFSGLWAFYLRKPSLFLIAGPTIAFKVRSEGEGHITPDFEFKAVDFGIAGGIGTQVPIGERATVRTEILYSGSIGPTNKTHLYYPRQNRDGTTTELRQSLRNHAIFLLVGFGTTL